MKIPKSLVNQARKELKKLSIKFSKIEGQIEKLEEKSDKIASQMLYIEDKFLRDKNGLFVDEEPEETEEDEVSKWVLDSKNA